MIKKYFKRNNTKIRNLFSRIHRYRMLYNENNSLKKESVHLKLLLAQNLGIIKQDKKLKNNTMYADAFSSNWKNIENSNNISGSTNYYFGSIFGRNRDFEKVALFDKEVPKYKDFFDFRGYNITPFESYLVSRGGGFVVNVPIDKCRGLGMQVTNLASDENPFFSTAKKFHDNRNLKYEESPLQKYYDSYRPLTCGDVFEFKSSSKLHSFPALGAIVPPWSSLEMNAHIEIIKEGTKNYWEQRGKALDIEDGATEFGPVSDEKGREEISRLRLIFESIQTNGYKPGSADIVGTLLVSNNGQWACHILDGLHRTSCMKALNYEHVPVLFAPNSQFNLVCREDYLSWKNVCIGPYSPEEAIYVFDRMIAGS